MNGKTKNPCVLVVTSMISRNSGGMSSALDLAESVHSLGYDCYLGLTGSSQWLYWLKDRKHAKTTIPTNRIIALPDSVSNVLSPASEGFWKTVKEKNKTYGRGLLYEIIGRSIASIINQASRRYFKKKALAVISSADIIIIASGFYSGANEIIKKHSSAKIILNHAGSPESYENWWLTKDHVPIENNPSLSAYVNYVKQFDYVLFQAQDQALACESKHKSLHNKSITIKPSCDELNVLGAKQSANPYYNKNYIIAVVGSIQPRKGQHYSVLAFSNVIKQRSNVEMHFVGGGIQTQYGQNLIELVNELNLSSSVYFHGHRRDYLRYMAHANIVLQTSEAEGVSRILRETMLVKTPIVSFAIPGTSDILENNREALLIEPFDVDKLSDGIIDLINKPDLREQLAQNALKRYFLEHSKAAYYNNLIKAIKEICYDYDES